MSRAPIIAGPERVKLREAMRKAYEDEGLTIVQVASRFSRSYGTTHVLLTEAKTAIRPRGGFHGR